MISLSYSRISLADIAEKLSLESTQDAEYIVAKAIRDGVIEAVINHEEGYVQSRVSGECVCVCVCTCVVCVCVCVCVVCVCVSVCVSVCMHALVKVQVIFTARHTPSHPAIGDSRHLLHQRTPGCLPPKNPVLPRTAQPVSEGYEVPSQSIQSG